MQAPASPAVSPSPAPTAGAYGTPPAPGSYASPAQPVPPVVPQPAEPAAPTTAEAVCSALACLEFPGGGRLLSLPGAITCPAVPCGPTPKQCPATEGGVCSGRGACHTASGACVCLENAAGQACEQVVLVPAAAPLFGAADSPAAARRRLQMADGAADGAAALGAVADATVAGERGLERVALSLPTGVLAAGVLAALAGIAAFGAVLLRTPAANDLPL